MPSGFVGREEELGVVRAAFARVVEGGGPELVVVLGESGLGKTRLVQEFYGSLAVATRSEAGAGYWPPGFGDGGGDLLVNPPLEAVDAAQEMPFMWWGLRVFDPERRNQGLTSAVATFKGSLEPHVAAMERAGRVRKHYLDVGIAAVKLALGWMPYLSSLVDVASGGENLLSILKAGRELHKDRRLALDEAELRIRDDLNERVVNVLGRLLRSTRDRAGVPTIVLIDNAQFSPADVGLVALFERFLREAWLASWPLLLLVTYWEREWHEHWADRGRRSVAGLVRDLHVPRVPGWTPLELEVMAPEALRPVLAEALPGLTDVQATALLERAGGQPLFLEEIVRAARQRSRHFQDRDPAKALTDAGLDAILGIGTRVVDFTYERLFSAPGGVRELVCLSSLQGTRLLQRINRRLAERMAGVLREADCVADDGTLAAAERPYAFLQREGPTIAEFAQRLFFDVARDSAADVFDVDDALTQLREVVVEEFQQRSDVGEAAERRRLAEVTAIVLEDSPEPDQRTTAAQALATLMTTSFLDYDYVAAVPIADRIIDGVHRGAWRWECLGFDVMHKTAATLDYAFRHDEVVPIARALSDLARDEHEAATALEQLASAYESSGDSKGAGQAWHDALKARRQLAKASPSRTTARNLCLTNYSAAYHELKQRNLETATGLFRDMLVLATVYRLEDELRLSGIQGLGEVFVALNKLPEALEHYATALAVGERLLGDEVSPHNLHNAGLCHLRIGDVLRAQNDLPAALEHYRRAQRVFASHYDRFGSPRGERGIGVSHQAMGDVLRALNELPAALEHYRRAQQVFARLSERVATPEFGSRLSFALASIGDIHYLQGDYERSKRTYLTALGIHEDLDGFQSTLSTDDRYNLCLTLGRISRADVQCGDRASAADASERAVLLLRGLTSEAPHTYGELLHSALVAWARVLKLLERYEGAAAALAEAMSVESVHFPNRRTGQGFVRASILGLLADTQGLAGRPQDAVSSLSRALEALLAESGVPPDDHVVIASSLVRDYIDAHAALHMEPDESLIAGVRRRYLANDAFGED